MSKIAKIQTYIFINKYLLLPIFGLERLLKLFFRLKNNQVLDFNNIKTYNEKIQFRKLDEDNSLYIKCADKYEVRKYVKEKVGEKYLIPIYFAKEKINEEDINKLPNSFVLKTNNGSSTNIIVFNKNNYKPKYLIKKMNKYVKIKFGYFMLELFYNKIKPKIIAEHLLLDNGDIPIDYKFHCFKEKNEYKIFIQVDYDRFSDHGRNMYDENWELLDFSFGFKSDKRKINKPENLDEMIDTAKKLASDFDYVRVDLYNIKNKIYFGELTFTHGGGYEKFTPKEYDKILGGIWKQEIV